MQISLIFILFNSDVGSPLIIDKNFVLGIFRNYHSQYCPLLLNIVYQCIVDKFDEDDYVIKGTKKNNFIAKLYILKM